MNHKKYRKYKKYKKYKEYRKFICGILAGLFAMGIPSALTALTPTPGSLRAIREDRAASSENIGITSEEDGGQVHQFAFSPGYPGLPFDDSYGDYQWALLNNGIFKLVPSNRVGLEDTFEGWLDGKRPGMEKSGPARESSKTTLAKPGMDINIGPAWKKYEMKEMKRHAVVAVVDTGVDYSHEDLWSSIWVNEDEKPGDGIDNDKNGYVDDMYGWNFYSDSNRVFVGEEDNHATHSAGTIAAARNGKGIVGINDPRYVKIMIVKALGTSVGVGSPENVSKGIRYAEANGAVICNLSFGTAKYSEELYQTMKNSKMLFVVAAGNGDMADMGYDIDTTPVYPAAFDLDNVISVANLRLDGNLDPASNYGLKSVDLAAPGNYILSTVSGNAYGYMSGTSMAAPMVTGAAAMLYSYNPDLQVGEIKEKLLKSVHKLDSLSGKTATGGILDVSAAMDWQ